MVALRATCFIAGLILLCSSVTRAEDYDPATLSAREILTKSRAAYGSFPDGIYRTIRHVTGGGTERTSTTYQTKHAERTVSEAGGFTTSSGTIDGQSWTQNANGIVTLRDGFHREDPEQVALQHVEDPKYNVRLLGITKDAPHAYVLDVNPPGGFDEQVYFDASTFLILKTVRYERDRYKHVTESGDFRTVDGKTLAFTVHSYDGRPQNDRVTTVVSVEKAGSQADPAMPAGAKLFNFDGPSPVTLPARFTSRGIVIRADVNGRGLDFLLDSGAAGLFIDTDVARELGLTPYGKYSATIGGGDVESGRVRVPHMSIGPLSLDDVVFETQSYTREIGDSRVVGLIGFDFLASGIFELDFNKGTLRILPRDHFDTIVAGIPALPLQLDDGFARTDVWVEGVKGHFIVDTGAANLLLHKDFVDRLPGATPIGTSNMGTVGGAMRARYISIDDLVFGAVKFKKSRAVEPVGSTFDLIGYDGIVGRTELSLFTCYFDYADGMLYTKYNP